MGKQEKNGRSIIEYGKPDPRIRAGLSGLISFVLVLSFPVMLKGESGGLSFTNSIVFVFVWLGIAVLMNRILQHPFEGKKRRWLLPGLFSLLFCVCMAFGASLDGKGSVPFTDGVMWVKTGVLAAGLTLIVRYVWDRLPALGGRQTVKGAKESKNAGKPEMFLTAVILFLCYLPVFLAVYPGFFVYDAQDELLQVITRSFSTHHPLFHVLLMGGIIQLVYKLSGSYNLGIACYTLFQMGVLSFLFSWCIKRLGKEGLGRAGKLLAALYFGLFPTVVMFVLCSAKDGIFTGMLLVVLLLLRELCRDTEGFFKKKLQVVMFTAAGIVMLLLRHNGFYAFVVFAALFLLLCKECRGKTLSLFGAVLIGFLLISKALAFFCSADASENQELLTVPIQQMARVYRTEGETLPREETEILFEVLSPEALAAYTPKVSDGVKIHFDNQAYEKAPGRYLGLWLKWGLKHPFTYLNAWFMTSYGFWYPDTVIDVYKGNTVFTFTYGDSSYFGYEVEEPGMRESKLPPVNELYRKLSLEVFQQKIPVLSMLFSPGFLFWTWGFILCFFWYGGEHKRLLAYLLPLLVWLTVILGPTYLVRYVVFLWFLLPVLCFDFWRSLQKTGV